MNTNPFIILCASCAAIAGCATTRNAPCHDPAGEHGTCPSPPVVTQGAEVAEYVDRDVVLIGTACGGKGDPRGGTCVELATGFRVPVQLDTPAWPEYVKLGSLVRVQGTLVMIQFTQEMRLLQQTVPQDGDRLYKLRDATLLQ